MPSADLIGEFGRFLAGNQQSVVSQHFAPKLSTVPRPRPVPSAIRVSR